MGKKYPSVFFAMGILVVFCLPVFSQGVAPGDVNDDGNLDLKDLRLSLQVLSGAETGGTVHLTSDVNSDLHVGLPEAFYNAQVVAGLRTHAEEMTASRPTLVFGAVSEGTVTEAQTVYLNQVNANPCSVNWNLLSDASWLVPAPASGRGSDIANISVNPQGLEPGTHTGTITLEPGTDTISTTLTVYLPESTSAPFGAVSTPLNNTTVQGETPVTGWALDDIGIQSVKIYRDPIEGEGSNLIYLADAHCIEGARPDLEQLYPDTPQNHLAGWGYLLLTNTLPNQGNGPFTLHVKTVDMEGNTVTLGTRTILTDNQNAVKPFGSIDTPAPGAVASGSAYVNWGWALTPLPNTIPFNGSTITVWVDGVPLGHPVYNIFRQDIADLFPGYNNSNGAVGYFYLDTTLYENGIHTISWAAEDDAGNTEGIGSRYFIIHNRCE